MWAFPMGQQGVIPTAYGLPGYGGHYASYGYPMIHPGVLPPPFVAVPEAKRKRRKKAALELVRPIPIPERRRPIRP